MRSRCGIDPPYSGYFDALGSRRCPHWACQQFTTVIELGAPTRSCVSECSEASSVPVLQEVGGRHTHTPTALLLIIAWARMLSEFCRQV